ncbi:MAG: hypothetical protein SFZ23_04490 [Planctomycetota bacterium]|nr:hypothetical protein [Planctomycetota bacterium]
MTGIERNIPEAPTRHHAAREAPPAHDGLWVLVMRRLSFSLYRSSRRYERYRRTVGDANVLPVGVLSDAIAVLLARRLPASLVARLGPEGLLRVSRRIHRGLAVLGGFAAGLARIALAPARWFFRGRRQRARARDMATKHAQLFHERSPIENAPALFGSAVRLHGYDSAAGDALTMYWSRVGPMPDPCQIFISLFPEHENLLPPERRVHGYFFKDHWPALPLPDWPRGKVYRDQTSLTDLPPGYYRVLVGWVSTRTLQRLGIDGGNTNAVELGWLRVGPSQVVLPERPSEAEEPPGVLAKLGPALAKPEHDSDAEKSPLTHAAGGVG